MRIGDDAVPQIGQGSTFGGKKYPDNAEVKLRVLEYGLEHGLNLIDTGEYYEGGVAEETIGKFIKGRRSKIFISDKFKASNNSYLKVIKSCEDSLKRLQTDYIDLYQIQWSNPEVPLAETLGALNALKEAGKIRHIGVCNFTFNEFKATDAVSIQTEYNLQNRQIEDNLLPYCKRYSKTLIGYNIFNQGFIGSVTYLVPIATKYNKSVYQIILAWAISKGILVLTNTMSLDHLKENIEATQLKLDKEDIDLIDKTYNPPQLVDVSRIKVVTETVDNAHKVYTTLQEVVENADKIHPSPHILAGEIRKNGLLKPIELKQIDGGYLLIHGSARFWAWQLVYENKPIPAFII